MSSEIMDWSVAQASQHVRDNDVSPSDLVNAALRRIESHNPRIGAFVTVCGEAALENASRADAELARGERRGPLHGIPVAVKDIISVRGLPVTACSDVTDDSTASTDAAVVGQLRDAGAIIVGTTALDEFAFGTVGPGIENPVAPDRSPGGSSGGSAAAVAAKLCYAALGTDTGGSVRIPASCCGIVGVKPTANVLSNDGVLPLAWSLDHVGWLTRDANDARILEEVLLGRPRDVWSPDFRALRVGIPTDDYLEVAEVSVRTAFEAYQEGLAASGIGVERVELLDSRLGVNLQYLTALSEAASYHCSRFSERLDYYGDGVKRALEWGSQVSAREYLDAQRTRTVAAMHIDEVLERVDLICLPTMPIPSPPIGQEEVVMGDGHQEDVVTAMLMYTSLFNHTGHPAISHPVRLASDGDDFLGVQFVGRRGAEGLLIQASSNIV